MTSQERLQAVFRSALAQLGEIDDEFRQRLYEDLRLQVEYCNEYVAYADEWSESIPVASKTVAATLHYEARGSRPPQAIVSLVKHLETRGNELVGLEIATPSLEDVFIELTGRRLRD